MTVRINNGASTLTWGTTKGSQIVGTLKFGSLSAANTVTLENGINLNGARALSMLKTIPIRREILPSSRA